MSAALRVAASVFATIFVGFGVNAMLNPQSALSFFELEYPTLSTSQKPINALMVVYGARDIFMGLAMYAAAYFGTQKTLGWITIAAAGVAGVDGSVCRLMVGAGEWGHWGYAPVVAVVGAMLIVS